MKFFLICSELKGRWGECNSSIFKGLESVIYSFYILLVKYSYYLNLDTSFLKSFPHKPQYFGFAHNNLSLVAFPSILSLPSHLRQLRMVVNFEPTLLCDMKSNETYWLHMMITVMCIFLILIFFKESFLYW